MCAVSDSFASGAMSARQGATEPQPVPDPYSTGRSVNGRRPGRTYSPPGLVSAELCIISALREPLQMSLDVRTGESSSPVQSARPTPYLEAGACLDRWARAHAATGCLALPALRRNPLVAFPI